MEAWLTTAKAGPRQRRWVAEGVMFNVYIIKSEKLNTYYVGYTSDLEKRICYHNYGKNKSTKNGIPWKLAYSEIMSDKKSAWLRELQIKSYKGGEAFKKLIRD